MLHTIKVIGHRIVRMSELRSKVDVIIDTELERLRVCQFELSRRNCKRWIINSHEAFPSKSTITVLFHSFNCRKEAKGSLDVTNVPEPHV